jgi:carbamate kinase
MTKEMAHQYIDEGQFAPGSMLPKVEAALSFVESTNGKPAYVGSLEKVDEVLQGTSGTKFVL